MNEIFDIIAGGIRVTDIIDILIVAFLAYKMFEFIKDTIAEQLVKGLILLGLVFFLSDVLNLNTLHWILKSITAVGIIALVIVFQPELRKGLEYVGRSNLKNFTNIGEESAQRVIGEFMKAIKFLSSTRTGALIVIERQTPLTEITESGTRLDAIISDQMIGNIFYEGAPLHDGAVIVRGDRIYAAGCVLPLTENLNLDKELGTRHRAGIGITEHSDAITIIVSEETGIISLAEEGRISRYHNPEEVEPEIRKIYLDGNRKEGILGWLKGGRKNV